MKAVAAVLILLPVAAGAVDFGPVMRELGIKTKDDALALMQACLSVAKPSKDVFEQLPLPVRHKPDRVTPDHLLSGATDEWRREWRWFGRRKGKLPALEIHLRGKNHSPDEWVLVGCVMCDKSSCELFPFIP